MAEQDAYLSGVGEYPTAPDTSVQAFLDQHPDYNNKYWRNLLNQAQRNWVWEQNDFNKIHSLYDQWSLNLTNQHNAAIKTWETKYASPASQSELKEAAGINRNWMTGEYSTQPAQSESISPFNNAGRDSFSPSQMIVDTLQNMQAFVDGLLDMKMKQAQIDSIETDTEATREYLPFKMLGPYMKGIKEYNEVYGLPKQDVTYLPITSNNGVAFTRIPEDSWYNDMLRLKRQQLHVNNVNKTLSNDQKRYANKVLLPIQAQIARVQRQLLDGNLSLQQFNLKLRKVAQPYMEKYAGKSIKQNYISNWVNLAVDSTAKLGGLFLDFKKFNKVLDFDLFKTDGDYGHLSKYE